MQDPRADGTQDLPESQETAQKAPLGARLRAAIDKVTSGPDALLVALAALAVFVAATTAGGFCISPAAGFYTLGAAAFIVALIFGIETGSRANNGTVDAGGR